MLKDFVRVEDLQDGFVGIRYTEGRPEVVFPRGHSVADDEKILRKDIIRLLAVLRYGEKLEGESNTNKGGKVLTSLPIHSYQYIISHFLSHGYLSITEIKYIRSHRGKISWKRTISQERPHMSGSSVVYLNFRSKVTQFNNDNLLTNIHKYCVYIAFRLFGWLYLSSELLPEKPTIKYNPSFFKSVLRSYLATTFNEDTKKLFLSMLSIIETSNDTLDLANLTYGTNDFYLLWEKLVDFAFGESDIQHYFPNAKWFILDDAREYASSSLRPDTIMKYQDKVYVLDAKYYKYGITKNPNDLPSTSSIQKQITYARHIKEKFPEIAEDKIFSAFIMPSMLPPNIKAQVVSVGLTTWEKYTKTTPNYTYILGILMDTRWVISNFTRKNEMEIEHIATLIENQLSQYRFSE